MFSVNCGFAAVIQSSKTHLPPLPPKSIPWGTEWLESQTGQTSMDASKKANINT